MCVSRLLESSSIPFIFIFFFNDTATTEIYTLSLHDALPIYGPPSCSALWRVPCQRKPTTSAKPDRKSTRLNSSHVEISYAVFCLKKKKITQHDSRFQQINILLSIICTLLVRRMRYGCSS